MSKTHLGPSGGAVPSMRPPEKMGAEHPIAVGPWKGTWPGMMKKSAKKKSRQWWRRMLDDE